MADDRGRKRYSLSFGKYPREAVQGENGGKGLVVSEKKKS